MVLSQLILFLFHITLALILACLPAWQMHADWDAKCWPASAAAVCCKPNCNSRCWLLTSLRLVKLLLVAVNLVDVPWCCCQAVCAQVTGTAKTTDKTTGGCCKAVSSQIISCSHSATADKTAADACCVCCRDRVVCCLSTVLHLLPLSRVVLLQLVLVPVPLYHVFSNSYPLH